MEEGNRDGEQWKRRGGGRGFLGKLGKGRGEGAVVGRSPGQMQGIKSIRRRLTDDDLGDIFSNISSVMRNEIVSVVGNTLNTQHSTTHTQHTYTTQRPLENLRLKWTYLKGL